MEKYYARKDGSTFPTLVGAAMIPGRSKECLAFILDISETERLKALNKAKDDFVALASHQLRTPATAVKQYLGILLQGLAGSVDEKHLAYIETANSANERQLKIINDLLKTAQIDTDAYQVALKSHDLVSLVNTVMEQYETTIQQKRQRFVFHTTDPKIQMELDETEMAVCIANLLENASKYSPENTDITVGIKKHHKHVTLTVSDEGVGIHPDDHEKIFEKFTRVDNELSDTVSGNGLGLYWVKRIVELHNGTIVITPKKQGTTFTVTMPL